MNTVYEVLANLTELAIFAAAAVGIIAVVNVVL